MSHSSYQNRRAYTNSNASSGWSGAKFDRYVENNSLYHSTTLGKVQKQFWFTKSAVLRKFGKNQDEHIVASDAELDAKMELFKAIEASTKELQGLLAEYQNKICTLAQDENKMGRLLKDWSKQEKGSANQVMSATGKSISYTAQQRLALRAPLVRLFQEVDTFHSRAIEDTGHTLEQMEKMRTEYRGALMWMKNISQDFNPDQYSQLEKFRQVQEIVRHKKAKFDALKIKSIQKIDLLAASRCNMFSHALILYQNAIITFSEKTAKTLNTVASNFQGYQHYNFTVIKELAEPVDRQNLDDKKEENKKSSKKTSSNKRKNSKKTEGESELEGKSDSLVNLYTEENEEIKSNGETQQNNLDLLTNNADIPDTEKDTQQMLKDLFDSPHRQSLPPPCAVGDISQDGAPDSQMYMPSQLLDFGLLNWDKESTSLSTDAPSMTPQAEPSSTTPSGGSGPQPSQQKVSDPMPGKSRVDWSKVFEDIDPLSDPANNYFGSKEDEKGSC